MFTSMISRSQQKRSRQPITVLSVSAVVLALVAAGCGSGDASASASDQDGPPTVLVTTSIWADVVDNVACGGPVNIETVMPIGADAHTFEPSLADRARFDGAALIVSNGIRLESGLLDTLAEAEASGNPVLRLGRYVDTIPYGGAPGHSHDDEDHEDEDHEDEDHEDEDHEDEDHEDEDHEDEDHDDQAAHSHDGDDPHFWFDPMRVADTLPVLADRLVDDVGLDREAVDECVASYTDELSALDDEIADRVAALPEERRLLVTNHDTLGYFADRYGFEVIGTVSTTPSGLSETNPADLEALAQVMEQAGSRTIFVESSASIDEAEALARRLGDAEVVSLFTESIGEPGGDAGTYRGLLATNADLILDALG